MRTTKTKTDNELTPEELDTARRRKEVREHLGRTLDHMIEGCQIISPDFRYLYVNQAVAKQGHNAQGHLLGHKMWEMYPGIERTDMFRRLKRCMRSRKLQSMENAFDFPDGSKGWFELRMEPVPEGVLILSEDITERKRAERDLLDALEDLQDAKDEINLEKITDRAILESVGEGLIAVDARGRIMMINKAAERLLGLKASDLQGRPITELSMLDSERVRIPAAKRPMAHVLKHGGFIGAIEVFRDISKEQEIDRAKTEFVSIASHQLRTPLGLTKWYLEAIQGEGLDSLSNVMRGYFDEVRKSNDRVLKVVRELLSVSRIDQGKVKDDPRRVNVVQMAGDIVHEMMPAAMANNVKLDLKAGRGRLSALRMDEMRLNEVLHNLVANALEYTPSGGSVTVTVGRKDGRLVVKVADTGIGVSEKDQSRMFSKFFRSEKAALNNPDGSGLGLYVVKSYVEGWGGEVTVKSREGEGSTFTITLPLKEKAK